MIIKIPINKYDKLRRSWSLVHESHLQAPNLRCKKPTAQLFLFDFHYGVQESEQIGRVTDYRDLLLGSTTDILRQELVNPLAFLLECLAA